MSNLGCQAQRSTPEAIAFAQRSPIVKGVNNVDILSKAPPESIRIFRWVFDNQNLSDPAGAFGTIMGRLQGYRHPNLYVETYNELPKEARTQYIDFLKAIVPMFQAVGIKVAGPSWATGDYEQEDWDAFRQANWCGLDAISVHGYWADRGFSQWNALRWRTYYEGGKDRHLMVFCTECGRDRVRDGDNGTMVGNGGWKADGLTAEQFAAELNAYGAQLLPHEYALPFVSGPESGWLNYSVDPVSAMLNTPSTPPTGGHPMIPGIDVSNHQGTIDWPLVARCGPQFAVIKATESTDYLDPYFAANWQKARDAGLVRGAYGFGRPSRGSGKADATYFLSAVKDIQQGDFLVLDLEDEKVAPTADLLAYTLDWLRTVEAAVGFKPLLYSGHYYLAPHNCEGHAELSAYGLWLASYQSTLPPVPKGWDWFAMWQYSDRGVVPGIGACDVDLFNGSLEQLKKYGKP